MGCIKEINMAKTVHVLKLNSACIIPYIGGSIISTMENKPIFRPDPDAELMDQVREVLRYYHYAYRTESHYCRWILRYIEFSGGKTHPRKLDAKHIENIPITPGDQRQCCRLHSA